ncbi:hypothetical protein [Nitratiruptor sp. YY09-18]|uniref:hypothetical protein n=1 Tax=Nitratiruptor sp. YY09-18 TaxID=2724901 RepID=UPI00191686EF|nr:hypothetical protein [Nitratiruptor sp. YY09-18]BCD68405.1 hypothetical protein NitYY0918_C1320 [Nitratiruptor sp. YY09-18]
MEKHDFENKNLEIAATHLRTSKEELNQCANTIFATLQKLENIADEKTKNEILDAVAALQMQDIITQRLDKVASFLAMIDKEVALQSDSQFLDQFAWENEVDQDDVDALFNEYKG